MKSLKVKALPRHLLEHIEVNIDDLKLNENIRVQDVKPENMEVMNSPRIPVASVTMTRQLKQEEAKAAPAAATAEPKAAAAPEAKAK
jgi:large subunit ribosomal protein L25